MRACLLILLGVLTIPYVAAEESHWDEAEAFYQEGSFDLALARYESLRLQEGTSMALEYNIGNTLMRLNRIPEAIARYRRALWLDPHDSDTAINLERARDLQNAQIPPLPLSRRLAGFLSARTWSLVFLVTAWILGGIGIARKYVRSLRMASAWIFPLGFLLLLISGCGILAMSPSRLQTEAVAKSATLTTRFEPAEDATEHFSVPGGSVVRVRERSRGWALIEVDDKSGWVPTEDLVSVGFPPNG